VDAWLRFEPTPGHTPGHVAIRLSTSAGDAVFSGDLMHRTVQVAEPQWSSRFCYDAKKARETRRAFVERHADSGVLILAAHFPTPGFIVRRDGGYRFAPTNGC
jgi:glyoxylase-like metal-dependent hydrolase (beta-lactamase superfamily II)